MGCLAETGCGRSYFRRPSSEVLADSAYAGAGHTRISDRRAERGQGSRADESDFGRVLFEELLHLEDEHAHEWIEQQRQNQNSRMG